MRLRGPDTPRANLLAWIALWTRESPFAGEIMAELVDRVSAESFNEGYEAGQQSGYDDAREEWLRGVK